VIADALLAYAHFAAILTLGAFMSAEALLLRTKLDASVIATLSRADLAVGIAAAVVLVSGLARLFYGAKGLGFYADNPLLYVKLGLFLVVGLISIVPTLRFLRWRGAAKADASFTPPQAEVKSAKRMVLLELHLFAFIPLAAVFMARGMGH
jgi:putative membrane protein